MPDGATQPVQTQQWDPVAAMRQKYPGLANEPDTKILQHLSEPTNFRTSFPEYGHLDDTTIQRNMASHLAATPTEFEKKIPGTGWNTSGKDSKFNWQGTGDALAGFFKNLPAAAAETVKMVGTHLASDPYGLGHAPEDAQRAVEGLEEDRARKEAGRSAAYRAVAPFGAAVGVSAPSMEQHAERGEGGPIVGEAAGPIVAALAHEVAKPLVGRAAEAAKPMIEKGAAAATDTTAKILRNEEGKVRPSVRAASRAAGALLGHYSGIPGADIAGVFAGPAAVEALAPERAPTVAKAVPITKSPAYDAGAYKGGAQARTTPPPPPAAKPLIRNIGAGAEPSEGRPATWDNETVEKLARWGDPDAIEQKRLRMLGGEGRAPLNFSSAETTPRSVTAFGPDGTPIQRTPSPAIPFSSKAGVMPDLSNVPDVELVEHAGPRGNASGAPGGGGLEEQSRMAAEKAQGVKYFREKPGGQRSELIGLGRQDLKAGPGERIIRVEPNGTETVHDEGHRRPAQPLNRTRPPKKD